MSFALDRYEPVALHVHPELMRAAEATTVVLHPGGPGPVPGPTTVPVSRPAPVTTPAPMAAPVTAPAPVPSSAAVPVSPPAPAPAPPEPIAAYLVGLDATGLLRAGLADFLDAAGSRRDVRVSVGVADGSDVTWVLRDQVPYGVRAMPHYPDPRAAPDAGAVLTAVAAVLAGDAADHRERRRLVVLLGDRPAVVARPPALAALVVHCVDAVTTPPPSDGPAGSSWVLARSRPGPRPSLLAHAGLLLDRWAAFAALPPGLVLYPVPGQDLP